MRSPTGRNSSILFAPEAQAARQSLRSIVKLRCASHMKSRIMYIESKGGGLTGPGRVGRVTFSKTGSTIYYQGRSFRRVRAFKHNYEEVATSQPYWISGPKRNGGDALYGGSLPVEIDEDVREEYWRDIRRQPQKVHEHAA